MSSTCFVRKRFCKKLSSPKLFSKTTIRKSKKPQNLQNCDQNEKLFNR